MIGENSGSSAVETKEGNRSILKEARDNAHNMVKKGTAIGTAVGGAVGGVLIGGPVGVAVGAGGGATIGYKIGQSVGIIKADKEIFEERLKDKWEKDEDVQFCNACELEFTQIRRKHHCRECGRIFCSKCCSKKKTFILPEMPGNKEVEGRVCENCYLNSSDYMTDT